MGWATIGAKGKPKQNDMLKALFSPGDKTVLPKTPGSVYSIRIRLLNFIKTAFPSSAQYLLCLSVT